ncbi:ABC transporter substrate-binding protein [Rhodospirillales bacterium TMPK1]|uniref:ABC transporter substrate-binding protein n=2 Tax=Roseiterribacter gracilis TaxID=2812848 RepID=A0A8S8X6W4_9PROT|nr:ABC transporter substrate-binding protein [Rhodospirillales bacterium TMPK1]
MSLQAQTPSADVVAQLAPTGALRVAINFGNPVLAQPDPAGPRGVSVDLARELARRLHVPVKLVTYDSAGKVSDAVKADAWDICFLAIDPVRAAEIDFTAPYVVIEGTYMVPASSKLRNFDEFDRDGIRIAVGRGSAYDLFLSREMKHAQLVRAANSPKAIDRFLEERLDAAAGVTQPLLDYAKTHPDVRVIPGRFMVIEQAMGVQKNRPLALSYLRQFIEEMKASGFVAKGLATSGINDATVAPPAR